ncbi:MAG: hypothetical protein FH758_12475 [Firmicutes bacterium]|nr:hypothetical protein [Bacillota bacterium]
MDFKKKFDQTLNCLGKKSEEIMDITKLKYSRYQIEKQRDSQFRDLGSYIYKTHQTNKTNHEKVADFVTEIQKMEDEIRKLNQKIEQRRTQKV